MEALIAKRTPVRATLTKRFNNLMDGIADQNSTRDDIEIKLSSLERVMQDLAPLDEEIIGILLLDAKSEKLMEEYDKIEDYKEKIDTARIKAKVFLEKFIASSVNGTVMEKTKLKLPQIEFIKYGGEVKDWLAFWSQFSRIHEDANIDEEDKFQYLKQCMVVGSRAREIVESYPPTAGNYTKVVDSLKSRFGREELLVEYYVRELLSLVVKNAMNMSGKLNIMQLYDKLESHLRSLETVGVTSDKYAAMLFPLVESCVPENLLRVWLRNPVRVNENSKNLYGDKLSQLLLFLRAEVEGEERISMARTGFKSSENLTKKPKSREIEMPTPSATDLFSGAKEITKLQCVFCAKSHQSRDCFKGQKLSLAEKKDILKKNNACYLCLKIGHRSSMCRAKICCNICSKKHFVIMCPEIISKSNAEENQTSGQDVVLSSHSHPQVLLQTLMVSIEAQGKQRYVRALLDNGSQRTYLLKTVVNAMGLQTKKKEELTHVVFGGKVSRSEHRCYDITVRNVENKYSCKFQALDQHTICGTLPCVKDASIITELSEHGILLSDLGKSQAPVELLIGADYAGTLYTGNIVQLQNSLVAMETRLGWVLMGKTHGDYKAPTTSLLVQSGNISDLWKLETIGIRDPCEQQNQEVMDRVAVEHFSKTVTRDQDGRYQISLPWLHSMEDLSNNREIAGRRLLYNTQKLEKADRFGSYDTVFQDWLKEEVIEKCTEGPGHYLPHRGVFKQNSSTNVRPVFDASCKTKGSLSLNDCLIKGPNLLEMIPATLLRFREKQIGVISDIKKAFLQIAIEEKHRKFLKFLWWKDKDMKLIQVFQHCRVVFGLNCSPFLLGAVLQHHLNQYVFSPELEVAQKLKMSFYVDNCVTSVNNEEELREFIKISTNILAEAKFELRFWEYTNDTKSSTDCQTSVLGLVWNKFEDSLSCDSRPVDIPLSSITRRVILSNVQRIFDPLGFISPITLCPKLLLQESWQKKMSWDDEVEESVKRKFQKWMNDLKLLPLVKIPRRAFLSEEAQLSLHVFCDASGLSYAAVVYLRSQLSSEVYVQLLMAKSRVAPLQKTTIPRLELLACCVGTRLCDFVKKSLKLENVQTTFWSDSTTALHWIKTDGPWSVFVRNRVKEIRSLSQCDSWKHIPGQFNPADLPSRGCTVQRLLEVRWWEGPPWLKLDEFSWPHSESFASEEDVSKEKLDEETTMLSNSVTEDPIFSYFSSYNKIVRMVGWIFRFINNLRSKVEDRKKGELSVTETNQAEKRIIKKIQEDSLTDKYLKGIKSLNIFKDEDGLFKVKTKLTEREDTDDFKLPIVLPGKHPLVQLLIRETHLNKLHAGLNILMSHLREHFWIISGRKSIRKVINRCLRCKWHSSKGVETVPIGLPLDRVKDAGVFEVVGVDLAGPLILKGGEKGWIVLFTCAVYRALHLEFVLSLSTKSFLLSLRRFIARRGRPAIIYSDNGTNFTGSENLFRSLEWDTITQDSAINKIEWKFIPPSAAWWGGFWERMVQMVKKILRRVLGKAALHYEEVVSLLCDCEAVINSRPITHMSEDPSDLVPLTPAMFLQDNRTVGVPDLDRLDETDIKGRWKYQQRLREHLRRRFRVEYLGSLVQQKGKSKYETLKVGDVVLIESDTKRVLWPLAKIIEVYPGKDSNVRVVKLKTSNGELIRPVRKLYPLEVNSPAETTVPQASPDTSPAKTVEEPTPVVRTRCGRQINLPKRLLDNMIL